MRTGSSGVSPGGGASWVDVTTTVCSHVRAGADSRHRKGDGRSDVTVPRCKNRGNHLHVGCTVIFRPAAIRLRIAAQRARLADHAHVSGVEVDDVAVTARSRRIASAGPEGPPRPAGCAPRCAASPNAALRGRPSRVVRPGASGTIRPSIHWIWSSSRSPANIARAISAGSTPSSAALRRWPARSASALMSAGQRVHTGRPVLGHRAGDKDGMPDAVAEHADGRRASSSRRANGRASTTSSKPAASMSATTEAAALSSVTRTQRSWMPCRGRADPPPAPDRRCARAAGPSRSR